MPVAPPDSVLLFVHIPKTAGMTMRAVLENQYNTEQRYLFSDAKQQANPLSAEEIKTKTADKHLIYGHMAYGIHEYLQRPYQYLTVLREPLAQTLSLINHYRREKNIIEWHGLEAFVGERANAYKNWQLKMLTSVELKYTDRQLTPVDLDAAKIQLQNEFLLGLSERFDESLLYFQQQLGWSKPPYYLKLNVSHKHLKSNTITFDDLTPSEQATLREWNAYDLDLYDYAYQLVDNQLKSLNITNFQVKQFQLANKIYYWKTVSKNHLKSVFRKK